MSVKERIDAEIERLEGLGLEPTTVVLGYMDHWSLSYRDLGGPDVGYPRPKSPYQLFVEDYRGLDVVCTGVGDRPLVVGVRGGV